MCFSVITVYIDTEFIAYVAYIEFESILGICGMNVAILRDRIHCYFSILFMQNFAKVVLCNQTITYNMHGVCACVRGYVHAHECVCVCACVCVPVCDCLCT